jgi:hypothetical protein
MLENDQTETHPTTATTRNSLYTWKTIGITTPNESHSSRNIGPGSKNKSRRSSVSCLLGKQTQEKAAHISKRDSQSINLKEAENTKHPITANVSHKYQSDLTNAFHIKYNEDSRNTTISKLDKLHSMIASSVMRNRKAYEIMSSKLKADISRMQLQDHKKRVDDTILSSSSSSISNSTRYIPFTKTNIQEIEEQLQKIL